MVPHIQLTTHDFRIFRGKTSMEIYLILEEVRIKVKKATNYGFDNTHFFYQDLNIGVSPSGFTAYSRKTGTFIDRLWFEERLFEQQDVDLLSDWAHQVSMGQTYCRECQNWVLEFEPYSFAGAVCLKCYDPIKHLPPDTRGD